MKLICPSCGAVHSADSWQSDGQAREALRIVAELPREVSSRCLPYLALFRPASRGLTWRRVLTLLAELKALIDDPYVQWKRNPARPNAAHAWGQAMERVINHPPAGLPLTSHGYLRPIAYEIANDLDRAAEKKEVAAERRGSARPARENASPEKLDPNWMKDIRQKNMRKKHAD